MPLYEYACNATDHDYEFMAIHTIAEHDTYTPPPCPVCESPMRRCYNVQIAPVMQEHYNPSIGRHISSVRHFDDALKQQQDSMSERLGYNQTFVAADPGDARTFGYDIG